MNTILNGVNEIKASLSGKTVTEVRGMLAQALNIDPNAQPTVGGETVQEDYILREGDVLEFVKASGKKG